MFSESASVFFHHEDPISPTNVPRSNSDSSACVGTGGARLIADKVLVEFLSSETAPSVLATYEKNFGLSRHSVQLMRGFDSITHQFMLSV